MRALSELTVNAADRNEVLWTSNTKCILGVECQHVMLRYGYLIYMVVPAIEVVLECV